MFWLFFRLFYRDPLGTLFGCFSAVFNVRAFGTSVGGRRDCNSKSHDSMRSCGRRGPVLLFGFWICLSVGKLLSPGTSFLLLPGLGGLERTERSLVLLLISLSSRPTKPKLLERSLQRSTLALFCPTCHVKCLVFFLSLPRLIDFPLAFVQLD